MDLHYRVGQTVDFANIEDVKSIKELILHDCTINNLSQIFRAENIKTVAFINCNITDKDLVHLKTLPKLKTVILGIMPIRSIRCLSEIPTLRELSFRQMHDLDYSELQYFPKLLTLSIKETNITSLDFLEKIKGLKCLELNEIPLTNLNFLKYTKKLREFNMMYSVEDETALSELLNIRYLKTFQYPVPDMTLYRNCPIINSIGVDSSRVKNLDALAGMDTIREVFFYNLTSREQFEEQLAEVKKHLRLSSYSEYIDEE